MPKDVQHNKFKMKKKNIFFNKLFHAMNFKQENRENISLIYNK